MLPFEDIAFQLVDLPPIAAGRMEPWMAGMLRAADTAWLVVDLADPACAEHVVGTCAEMEQRKITLTDCWPGLGPTQDTQSPAVTQTRDARDADDMPDPFQVQLPTLADGDVIELHAR
jgi:uncharacterized protein